MLALRFRTQKADAAPVHSPRQSDMVAPMTDGAADQPLRIDRWLWAARFFRSRTLAAAACASGRVTVNDQRATAHKLVRPSDVLEITTPDGTRRIRVLGTNERRGPAPVARLLYDDLTPPAPPRERSESIAWRDPGAGRPTKRDRRRIDRWREG